LETEFYVASINGNRHAAVIWRSVFNKLNNDE
jgi:hypothetical protein